MADRPRITLSEDDFDGNASERAAASASGTQPAAEPRASAPSGAGADSPGMRHEWLPTGAAAGESPLPPVTRHAAVQVGDVDVAGATPVAGKAAQPAMLVAAQTSGLVAAATGMVLAWLVTELVGLGDIAAAESKFEVDAQTGLWTSVIA